MLFGAVNLDGSTSLIRNAMFAYFHIEKGSKKHGKALSVGR